MTDQPTREPWIEIEIETMAEFKINELWPDGDAPNPITEEEVWKLINQVPRRHLIDEWFFPTPDVRIRLIDPNSDSAWGGVDEIRLAEAVSDD